MKYYPSSIFYTYPNSYCPLKDDYKAGNLMRVFFDNMYEYYR